MWRSPPPSQLSVDQKLGQSEENGAKNKDEGVKMCVKSNIENEPVECTGTVSPPENASKIAANKRGERCAFFSGDVFGQNQKIEKSSEKEPRFPKKTRKYDKHNLQSVGNCNENHDPEKCETPTRPKFSIDFQRFSIDFQLILNRLSMIFNDFRLSFNDFL